MKFKQLDVAECFSFTKRGKLAVKVEPYVYRFFGQRRDRLVLTPHENRKVFSRACPRNGHMREIFD
jgi:hypothetical protein